MRVHLYTVHRKGERGLKVVPDRFDWLAASLGPVWLVWHGLWIAGAALVIVVAGTAAWNPLAALVVLAGANLVFACEGGSVMRAELTLRGWREAGVVQAASTAGAEEFWLTGQAA